MTKQLFRHEVVEAGRDRLAGAVIAAVPPSSRLYTGLLIGVAAVVILLLLVGSYSSRAEVRGTLSYDSGIARVYPSSEAEVRAIHVRTGQAVAAGAPLVTLSMAQGIGGVSAQLSQIDAQDSELARQLELTVGVGSQEARAIEVQKAGLAAAISSLRRQRSLAAAQIQLAQAAARRAVELAREGAGTQRQVEDSRSLLLSRRGEVESLDERIISQQEALASLEARSVQRGMESDRSRSILLAQRAALAEQRAGLARSDGLVLTAPVAGRVGDIGIEIGQRARPDHALVTLIPQDSRLEVWLYAPSRAAGFVRPGQRVRIKFDAFPYQKYGVGEGTATAVSAVALEPASLDPSLGIDEPVFRIRVRLDRAPPGLPARASELRPGMTLGASLILERRSLWEAFLSPILGSLQS